MIKLFKYLKPYLLQILISIALLFVQANADLALPDYLSKIINATTAISEIVTIELSTDMPLRLDFNQPKDGKLEYYLAPRIETE